MEIVRVAKRAAMTAKPHLSNFRVGAAFFLTRGDRYVTGCNIEFDIHTNTIHAEIMAVAELVRWGQKATHIAVHCEDSNVPFFPCGLCRQALFEKCGPDLIVIATCGGSDEIKESTIGQLLPDGFRLT